MRGGRPSFMKFHATVDMTINLFLFWAFYGDYLDASYPVSISMQLQGFLMSLFFDFLAIPFSSKPLLSFKLYATSHDSL